MPPIAFGVMSKSTRIPRLPLPSRVTMGRMETPSPQEAAREAIRHWHNLPQLAEFAVLRHGYLNTDMGFGVTYPDDLDEYARVVECEHIPDGFVRVNGFEGPPDGYEVLVEEVEYLR